MATTISTQDIVDAKRDIEDIGEAVNEVKIVSPRYGEDFKSIPMISAEGQAAISTFESNGQSSINGFETSAQNTINNWESAIALITQEGGVPALAVYDASGKTQQQINNNIAVKILRAAEIGLTKWSDFKKPPYSAQEYEQAYNNGVRLASAIMSANANGYSKVVLERGLYPVCYKNDNGGTNADVIVNNTNTVIENTVGMEVDGNSSTLFVIFDSNNRNPYDKSTTIPPSKLGGNIIGLQHNTDLNIHGFTLRGDQYNRSWVSGEETTENTCGIFMGKNNINTKIDIVGTGFRADAVSGNTRGSSIASLDNNWTLGGLNTTTGAEIVEAGSYRSPRIDLQGKTIYRNAVQIMTTGYLRAAEFRNDLLGVFFYDANGNFILSSKARQCEFIYLPVNCRYIQFVAYEDERTAPTVGYGTYIFLATGSSDTAEVKGEYYANHRGAVSNLCNNTTVDANIHDNGTLKYGFPHYGDPTRYGVNFEDIFVSKLTVRGSIQNGIQAILCNAKTLDVRGVTIRDMQYSAVAAYGTFETNIIGCAIDNVGILLDVQTTSARKKGRLLNFHSNTVKNSVCNEDVSDNPDVLLSINDNTFSYSSINLAGNGSNIVFDNNTIISVSGRYTNVLNITGALSTLGNTINRASNVPELSRGWGYVGLIGRNSGNNLIMLGQSGQRLLHPRIAGQIPVMRGTELEISTSAELLPILKEGTWASHVDVRRFEKCTLNSGLLLIGNATQYTSLCNSQTVFDGSQFKNGFYIEIQRRESVSGSVNTLVIKNSLIDLTNSTQLVKITYTLTGTYDIQFINCDFISDAPKSIAFIQGQLTNVTARAIGCKFVNVTNTDSVLVVE